MSLIAGNAAQRDQAAAAFGGAYAVAKAATDSAALSVLEAQQQKDKFTEADIIELKNNFTNASEYEQKVLMEMLANGQIPVGNLNGADLIGAKGFNGATPAFLNDAKFTVLGWLGNDSMGSVNSKIIASILQDPMVIPTLESLNLAANDGSILRAQAALSGAALLSDLKASAEKALAKIESDLLQSQLSGSVSGAALAASLARQRDILGNINNSIMEGNVSTTNKNLISMCLGQAGSAGELSSIIVLPPKGGAGAFGSGSLSGIVGKHGDGIDSALGTGVWGKPGGDSGGTTVWWDAGGPAPGILSGVYDDIIVEHVEPKLKHAYHGEFPDKLSVLNWLIKTMDRPKIDVEYVEQLRNNVKRNYPIKYNFGDLSITFWDDVKHVTITTIEQYFHGNVWNHGGSKKSRGEFLMRDSVVIPKFIIKDYVMETKKPLIYTFYNASLSSFDFDSHDDLDDGGVHTVQVVLKIEGFSVKK